MQQNKRYTFRHPFDLHRNPLIVHAGNYYREKYADNLKFISSYFYFLRLCEQMLKKERSFLKMDEIDEVAKDILLWGQPDGEILNEDVEDIKWLIFKSGLFEMDAVNNTFTPKDMVFEYVDE